MVLGLSVCCSGLAQLEVKKTVISYSKSIPKETAEKFAAHLLDIEFLDGNPGKIQLIQKAKTIQVRFIMHEEAFTSQDALEHYHVLRHGFASVVFDGEQVEIHFCDDNFVTKKVIKENIPLEFMLLEHFRREKQI